MEPNFLRPREGERIAGDDELGVTLLADLDQIGIAEIRAEPSSEIPGSSLDVVMEPTCSDAWFETFGRPLGTELGLDCEVMCAELDLEAKPAGDTPRMQLIFRRA